MSRPSSISVLHNFYHLVQYQIYHFTVASLNCASQFNPRFVSDTVLIYINEPQPFSKSKLSPRSNSKDRNIIHTRRKVIKHAGTFFSYSNYSFSLTFILFANYWRIISNNEILLNLYSQLSTYCRDSETFQLVMASVKSLRTMVDLGKVCSSFDLGWGLNSEFEQHLRMLTLRT